MTQKVIKIGTSVGVTIPKQALRDLDIRAGDHIEVDWSKQRGTLVVRHPAKRSQADRELKEWTERFIERYKPALIALSKK